PAIPWSYFVLNGGGSMFIEFIASLGIQMCDVIWERKGLFIPSTNALNTNNKQAGINSTPFSITYFFLFSPRKCCFESDATIGHHMVMARINRKKIYPLSTTECLKRTFKTTGT